MTNRNGITEITAPIAAGSAETPLAVHFANEDQGGLKFFATAAEMTTFAQKQKERCFKSVAFVQKGENDYPSIYAWTGGKPDGTDGQYQFVGYIGGVVAADVNGAVSRLNSTFVFGDDFEIQEAGDQGNGLLVQLSDAIKQAINTKVQGSGFFSVGTYKKPDTFNKGNILELEYPLKAWADADKSGAIRISMDHAAFEPMHAPSYLAYLGSRIEVVGKISEGEHGHRDGAMWFDKIVCDPGAFIVTDRTNKAYGIQEADELDPNVSGGTDYLIAFRTHFDDVAPDDGFVRAYIYDKSINPYSPKGYLEDTSGNPLVVERYYKKGEKLLPLEVVGVVNAKGLQEFTCHVVDDFVNDRLNLTDPYYGETGLMIQALTSESSTSIARQQFEQDTGLVIHDARMYLGDYRMDIAYMLGRDKPMELGEAGDGQTMVDGLHFYNLSPMKIGIQSGHLVFEGDGVNICDFSFGKIFSAEETIGLRGKKVVFDGTLIDKNCGWNIGLIKWTGKPDEYTKEIYTSRGGDGNPVFQTNWALVDTLFVSEDVVNGDHDVTKEFTVPTDANNYALIIYPIQAQLPMNLKLKKFKEGVKTPFIYYPLRGLEKLDERHYQYSTVHKTFVQNAQGYASLRYTLNDSWVPMPAGIPDKGLADIKLDPSINKVNGSSAKGGEGVYLFSNSGKVSGYIDLLVWNEQSTVSQVQFKLVAAEFGSKAIDMENGDAIASVSAPVPAGSKGTLVRLHIPDNTPVITTERWALVGKSDKTDGAFIECNNNAKPMLKAVLTFKELMQAN